MRAISSDSLVSVSVATDDSGLGVIIRLAISRRDTVLSVGSGAVGSVAHRLLSFLFAQA